MLPHPPGRQERRSDDEPALPPLVPALPVAVRLGRGRAAGRGRRRYDPADRNRCARRRAHAASRRGHPRYAEPAQPCLPARHGRADRTVGRRGKVGFLVVAPDHVHFRRAPRAAAGRSDRGPSLCRDAEGRLHRRRRVPLSAQPAGRRPLQRRCGTGPARRGRRGSSRPETDAAAGPVSRGRLRRRAARPGPAALPAGDRRMGRDRRRLGRGVADADRRRRPAQPARRLAGRYGRRAGGL